MRPSRTAALALLWASLFQQIGAFLPSTQALDPGATGFNVREAVLGFDPRTLAQEGTPPVPRLIFNISGVTALPFDSYVVANLVQSDGKTIATANPATVPGPIADV